ncbi:hypothetical protein OSTOST_17523, partial [Ostertagia ostertagi]
MQSRDKSQIMDGTVTKKARVWNPAVDNDMVKDKLHSDQDQSSNDIPNYFHLARVQQQRVVEEAIRRGFTQPFPMQPMPMMTRAPPLPAVMSSQQTI